MGQENYLAIDIGATKTLFAVFDTTGRLVFEYKMATNPEYQRFKSDISAIARNQLGSYQFSSVCCAVPAWLDLKSGIALAFGNLPWQNIHIKQDLQELFSNSIIYFHNDAKLAGLSEARLLHRQYRKVLYLTISTGIGGGVIIDDVIHPDFSNFEPGQMKFQYDGKLQDWEDFASGRALHQRTGKLASEINDQAVWKDYAGLIAMGMQELLATIQPDVVVIGGGVGAHFEKFQDFLNAQLNANRNPMVPVPPIIKAQRPEEAVIYGCYDYITQSR